MKNRLIELAGTVEQQATVLSETGVRMLYMDGTPEKNIRELEFARDQVDRVLEEYRRLCSL
ncbi:hypothetical protein ACFP2T_43330 [Plantactinospora solaniradicis]|uniref:Uncharacterized protein n=1 Tax=Plantactinospora solaniradicis TaxID=1723736 RepID=A0ABW1KMM2_9ACTN